MDDWKSQNISGSIYNEQGVDDWTWCRRLEVTEHQGIALPSALCERLEVTKHQEIALPSALCERVDVKEHQEITLPWTRCGRLEGKGNVSGFT